MELARQLHLTRAAVTEIVNSLQRLHIIREVQGHRSGGRHPIALEINPELGYVIGIDIGATHVTLVLADFSARVIGELGLPLDIEDGPQIVLQAVDEAIQRLLEAANVSLKDVKSIGVGVPGPIVKVSGWVSSPSVMDGWDRYPLRDHFIQTYGCPVALNNDAELGALGEWAYGAGRGERNLIFIKVGTGIGAGLLLDGQIYSGTTGSAGEIGHITIDENGPLCSCGNFGCLESVAGRRAIERKAIAAVQSGQRTQLSKIEPLEQISTRHIIAAAREGDIVAQRILIETGKHLGTAIASIVNLFNPSMIVVGGVISQIGDLFLESVRQTVQTRSLRAASRNVRITTSLLGMRSSAVGAVVAALSIVLHHLAEK